MAQRSDLIGAVCVTVAAIVALVVYFLLYSPAVARGVEAGAFGAAGTSVLWLRLHILLYVGAYLLLVAGLSIALLYRRTGAITRIPWAEATVVAAGILATLGVNAGERFARPVWGFVPTWSDSKLTIATITAWTLLLVGSTVAILARVRLDPRRRYAVLAIVTMIAIVFGGVSLLLGRFTRSIHPVPILPWWP